MAALGCGTEQSTRGKQRDQGRQQTLGTWCPAVITSQELPTGGY